MSVRQRGWRSVTLGLMLVATTAPTIRAQGRAPSILSVSAGASEYSLSGTGTTFVLAGRVEGSVGAYAIIEPGITFLSYRPDFGGRVNYLLPEISLQGQIYLGRLRPYVGGGIGFANTTNGPNLSKLTLHATGGGRFRLGGPWGVRFEFRARSIDPWRGTTADFTLGISRMTAGGF